MLGKGGPQIQYDWVFFFFSETNITTQQKEHQVTGGPIGLIVHAKMCQEERYGVLFLTVREGTLPAKPKIADFHHPEW